MRSWRDSPPPSPDGSPVDRDEIDPVVAVCSDANAARDVVRQLGDAGFSSACLSIVGKGSPERGLAEDNEDLLDRLRHWGSVGGACGAIGGLLLSPVLFFVAPVGLLAVGGPFALALLTALEGALVGAGASAVIAALTSVGVGDQQARCYEDAVAADGFLVIVHGAAPEIERARRLLGAGEEVTGAAGPPARTP